MKGLVFTVSERWEKGNPAGVMLRAGKTEIGLSQDDWKKASTGRKDVGRGLMMVNDAER